MQSKNSQNWLNFQENNGKINHFFKKYAVSTLAYRCGMVKQKGIPVVILLMTVFSLPFTKCNMYQYFNEKSAGFNKDALYTLMRSPNIGWRNFLKLLALKAIGFFASLSNDKTDSVLIADSTILERKRAKKVELCSRVYDYVEKKFTKGFRAIFLGHSDGNSFIPIDFSLMSASKANLILHDSTKIINSRSCGGQRRKEAKLSTVELLVKMLKRAKQSGVKASHILMDSWFCTPKTIKQVANYFSPICMAKKTSKIHYCTENGNKTLKELYRTSKKRPGRAKWLTSICVSCKNELEVRIIFVRHKYQSKEWIALLTTDKSTSEEEIIRLYGLRWDIEVFFRTIKQHLGFNKGVQVRDFDSIVGHVTIVSARYIFLSVDQRKNKDVRSLGTLFRACCQELESISLTDSVYRILGILFDKLTAEIPESTKVIEGIFQQIIANSLEEYFNTGNKQHENLAKVA